MKTSGTNSREESRFQKYVHVCMRALMKKMKEYEGKTLVFVSHGDNLMLAADRYKGLPISLATLTDRPYIPMAGGYKIDLEDTKVKIQSI